MCVRLDSVAARDHPSFMKTTAAAAAAAALHPTRHDSLRRQHAQRTTMQCIHTLNTPSSAIQSLWRLFMRIHVIVASWCQEDSCSAAQQARAHTHTHTHTHTHIHSLIHSYHTFCRTPLSPWRLTDGRLEVEGVYVIKRLLGPGYCCASSLLPSLPPSLPPSCCHCICWMRRGGIQPLGWPAAALVAEKRPA